MAPDHAFWLVLAALGLGTAKSVAVMDGTAKRGVQRIDNLKDGTCLGAVYTWKTWLLAGSMMGLGITMRRLMEPGPAIGILSMGIGWALFFSSRHPWDQWLKYRQGNLGLDK